MLFSLFGRLVGVCNFFKFGSVMAVVLVDVKEEPDFVIDLFFC